MQRHLLLGTAGHIDHGKTALIRALTGVDTDRLPEEKRRGITVDLGFAALELDDLLLGIVDVPGHERFIKNMLAGATGIDMALLVVAADEGVMPQTREHFEALSYLRISAGVIAITKCDLVDQEMITLVEDEVSKLASGSFLQDAPIIHVSIKDEKSLSELRSKLARTATQLPEQNTNGPFRLSIDRCFSVPGMGTVITGSVASGHISCGDKLQLLPDDVSVAVRGIESHSQSQTTVGKGQRAALNLSGIHYSKIARGHTLATPDSLAPSQLLSVSAQASRFRDHPLKYHTNIRFYSGATETPGKLRLLESKALPPGESQIAQIELQQSICATWGEPFVIRGLAANEVLGGGQVVDPCAFRVSPSDSEKVQHVRTLYEGSQTDRVIAVAALAGARPWTLDELPQRAGIANGTPHIEQLVKEGTLCQFNLRNSQRWLHKEVVSRLEARLLESINTEHESNRIGTKVNLGKLQKYFSTLQPPELLTHLALRLSADDRLQIEGEYVSLPEWQPQLSALQSKLLKEIVAECQQAELTPPSVANLADKYKQSVEEIESLLQVAVDRNELIRLPDKDTRDAKAAQRARLYLHASAEQILISQLHQLFAKLPNWTVSQFGEELGLSRKYAIPLCNHLDQTGITTRQGDIRKLAK